MSKRVLTPVPLTAERFAPYGDVIQTVGTSDKTMNDARFDRFDDLAKVDIESSDGGHVSISIVKSKTPTTLPHQFDLVERHPMGSQAFIPLSVFVFAVVVAPAGESVDAKDLRAFVSNGSQGINYHRGVWHMPLIATIEGSRFLVVDRAPGEGNVEEVILDQPVILQAF